MQVRPYRPCSNAKGPSFEGGWRKTAALSGNRSERGGPGDADRKLAFSCIAGGLAEAYSTGKENSLRPRHCHGRTEHSRQEKVPRTVCGWKEKAGEQTTRNGVTPQLRACCRATTENASHARSGTAEGKGHSSTAPPSPAHLEVSPSYREWKQARMSKLKVRVAV